MEHALKGLPSVEPAVPLGVVNIGGEWYFEEFARGAGVASLGLEDAGGAGGTTPGAAPPATVLPPNTPATPAPEERRRILDLFRN